MKKTILKKQLEFLATLDPGDSIITSENYTRIPAIAAALKIKVVMERCILVGGIWTQQTHSNKVTKVTLVSK